MSKNVRAALVVFIATLGWFLVGMWKAPDVSEQESKGGDKLTAVKAAWFQARPYASTLMVRGRTEANRAVSLRAEVSGRVVEVPAERGTMVAEGDVICRLAREERDQRVIEAKAALAEAQLQYKGALQLKEKGYQSEVAIAQAKASLELAKANLERRQLDVENTVIRAPFDGVLQSREVEVGDYMDRGNICAEVLEVSPLKVSAQVSEQKVQQIVMGRHARVWLVNGEEVTGQVSYISNQADPQTRTYNVEISIPNPDSRFRAGLTARLELPFEEVTAQRIPSGLLTLGDAGEIGVRVLTDDHIVSFRPIQIIGDEVEGVWVLGLPERTLLITVGHEYVANGEEVRVEMEDQAYTTVVTQP